MSKEYPTLAFHASINNSFGKGSLIQLLRQFAKLHSDKKQISVGFIGYPNTGKSSIINTLRSKRVCTVAPVPGETKVWQFITLMRRIYLIDCPGVVQPNSKDSETDIILKGVVRIESVKQPEDHIAAVLARVRKEYIQRTYGIAEWEDHIDFLTQFARKTGKLLKGAEPNIHVVSKMILHDWLRGKIPYYEAPPEGDLSLVQKSLKAKAVPGVEQKFNKIRVDNDYMKEDLVGPAEEETAEVSDASEGEEPEAEEDEEDLDWDEVFEHVVGEETSELPENSETESVDDSEVGDEVAAPVLGKRKAEDIETVASTMVSDSESEEEKEDGPRMTTNKGKVGTHYYESANIKNKNRAKTEKRRRTMDIDPRKLEKKFKGDGKRRMK